MNNPHPTGRGRKLILSNTSWIQTIWNRCLTSEVSRSVKVYSLKVKLSSNWEPFLNLFFTFLLLPSRLPARQAYRGPARGCAFSKPSWGVWGLPAAQTALICGGAAVVVLPFYIFSFIPQRRTVTCRFPLLLVGRILEAPSSQWLYSE